jgi:hypothetical protein
LRHKNYPFLQQLASGGTRQIAEPVADDRLGQRQENAKERMGWL